MKILLDECLDRRLAALIPGHEVITVPQNGWAGIKNGELMKLASASFEVFITVDRNLSFQQNLASYDLIVIVLRARSNRIADLEPFASVVLDLLPGLSKGEATFLSLAD